MSEAYERERQNNDSLNSLSAKVSALRSVTIDIYDNARDQHVIDSTSETFSTMAGSLQGSSRRLITMAQSGNKVAVLKLAGIIIAAVVLFCEFLVTLAKAFGQGHVRIAIKGESGFACTWNSIAFSSLLQNRALSFDQEP
ncbi:hypothetical protein BST61_g4971 [Cercospora zeina]